MAERIATSMSIITVTFIVVTVAAIIRGIYIVRQKQRESKMREALYFNKMKMDNEKKKAEQLKEQKDEKESNYAADESTEQVKKEVELDWLTGEPIYEDK